MSDGYHFLTGDDCGDLIPLTAEQVADAQRYVASRATDADDLRTLLDMLNIGSAA